MTPFSPKLVGFSGIRKDKYMRICKVEGCSNKYSCKGYCSKHYAQFHSNGMIFSRTIYDPNEIVDCEDYCEVILYNFKYKEMARALIDKYDIEKVKQYKWHLNDNGYVTTAIKGKGLRLHHLILKRKKEFDTDHINGNKLDNRKNNLRYATRSQNAFNRKNTKGVSLNKNTKKWRAQIHLNYKQIYLGLFDNKADALKARREAELKYFSEFAYKK